MSAPKPPPGKGKPFLPDDDLLSELDQWDATFDALHGAPDPGEQPAAEPPMEWPAPDPSAGDSAIGDKTNLNTFEDLDRATLDADVDLDDQLTLDGALEAEQRADIHLRVGPTLPDAAVETDFSDIGAEEPAALGELLGRSSTAPPIVDDEPEETRIRQRSQKKTMPPEDVDDADDGVYTSASRPNRAPPAPDFDDDDALAPPPKPLMPLPEVRRGPAIIRRMTGAVEVPKVDDITPSRGTDAAALLAERTRVATYDNLGVESAGRSQKKTLPPPIDDDDYADIEIDESESAAPAVEMSAPASEPVARRTAHVVRRGPTPTRPPPPPASGPVVEMDIDESLSEPVPAPRPPTDDYGDFADFADFDAPAGYEPAAPIAAEDDFSDVAAAVGAEDSLDLPPPPPRPAPRTTPPPPPRPSRPTAQPRPVTFDLDTEAKPASLEDALGGLDEPMPTSTNRVLSTDFDEPSAGLGAPAYRPFDDDDLDPAVTGKFSELDRAAAPLPDTDRGMPTLVEPTSARPPALTDLYQRVKTPTSVPPLGQLDALFGAQRAPSAIPIEVEVPELPEPELDLETLGRAWPEQVDPLPPSELDESAAASLLVYEREVATLDDSESSAALRVEAGRLCERLSDLERARAHYDAALLADPRATAALRGLRRIARASGDLAEATRHLDTEIAVAGALERRPLGHHRVDLLMASGEQDLARVAVGEILDSAPSDVRALLAQLELAFVDGRADEFGIALEQLAHAVTDHELRAAVQSARGVLAAHHDDTAGAATWFAAAAESDPNALAARLGAIRYAAGQGNAEAAARALLDLARQIAEADPVTAAAAALRAQQWTTSTELASEAAQLATAVAGTDPLVARLAAEAMPAERAADAFAQWASVATSPAERAYAAARAAELDTSRAAELWSAVLALDPGDDYAAAQLRTAHVAAQATQESIEVDLVVAADVERDRARLRAAYGMIAEGQLERAIEVLAEGRAARPGSLAIAEALGEALAAAGRWTERAKLFAELAEHPGEELDADVAQLRSALAWEEAVGAAAASAESGDDPGEDLTATTRAALAAWGPVLERDPSSPSAHAAAIVLASRLDDREAFADVLARAQATERSPWAAASLALRRARLLAAIDASRAEALVRDLQPADDPRRTVALVLAAARRNDSGDAALALEDRANQLDQRGAATEVAALRLRAAQLALDDADAPRATRLLEQVEQALPHLGVVPDLLAAARRRAGDRPSSVRRTGSMPVVSSTSPSSSVDAFARVLHDADLASQQGDAPTALALYQEALAMRPGDPLAMLPLIRTATELRETAPITSIAFAQLHAAEAAGDGVAKAIAYELLASVDAELRGDPASAQIAIESALQSDPSRIDLMLRLERQYTSSDALADLLRLRKAELEAVPVEHARDRAALQVDLAGLATRDGLPELEVADLYRQALATDAKQRLALLHLESIVRRAGSTEELADLEDKIADYFEGDPRSQAAFWTRAGETLAELGRIDDAVQRFGRADTALPGHVPALEGWRQTALKGQLWLDVAEAASRQAANTQDLDQRAALYHFAGVVLMDKALIGEQAMIALRRALVANPRHKDAFLRLRILLEEDANHDELATLLGQRLEFETDATSKIELHRALAELHRNFLSDRDTAKQHYRMILEADPNDLRAHAAVADIAWEQGEWQEAADALMARARLERQPEVLRTLCYRLGLIYADRLTDLPMALKAFQRALTYQPDDEQTLARLADLATQAGEWKLALGACERLVKNEQDPDHRVAHLHRVARIFRDGFGDTKRAERALNLALDGSPTNDEALQAVVQFYKDARDITSVRVHLNRVIGTMRARVQKDPQDGIGYRVISRAMMARASTNLAGSRPIARAAAELAELLGAAGEPESKLLAEPNTPDLSLLTKPEADDVLFPRSVQPELRQIFQLLGDRIAKHVGVDLRPYGATRGDRLRARDNPVASVAQSVATQLGYQGEIDVYVSNRQPWAMVAEPTSPVSVVVGAAIANLGGDAIRFAAGSALKLAHASLAIPSRLPLDELGVLTIALLRLFQPEFPALAVDADAVAAQLQKLKRLIPTSLMNELKPFALAIDAQQFGHRELARDLKVAGLRAGLVASGSLAAGLRILAGANETELPSFLADPVARALVEFALGEDHAAVAR